MKTKLLSGSIDALPVLGWMELEMQINLRASDSEKERSKNAEPIRLAGGFWIAALVFANMFYQYLMSAIMRFGCLNAQLVLRSRENKNSIDFDSKHIDLLCVCFSLTTDPYHELLVYYIITEFTSRSLLSVI